MLRFITPGEAALLATPVSAAAPAIGLDYDGHNFNLAYDFPTEAAFSNYDEATMLSKRAEENAGGAVRSLFRGFAKFLAAETGVQANKLAGDAMRDAIALREAPALREVSLETVGGIRSARSFCFSTQARNCPGVKD